MRNIKSVICGLFLVISFSSCATIKGNYKGCQPTISDEKINLVEMINNPDQDWVCARPWWRN